MEKTQNVKVYIVEAAFGDREFEIIDESNPNHLGVRTHSEIWIKENLVNLGVQRLLPKDWKYMAWVDMDIHFRDPNWAQSTLHALQHYNIVQPWSHAVDLDFHGGISAEFNSFGYLCANRKPMWHGKEKGLYCYAHTGFAWACTRYFYENVRELLDICIVGAGDHHMAWACLNKVRGTIHQGMCEDYYDLCEKWEHKAHRASAGIVGYTHGRIEHHFHGNKENRKYWGRWEILIDNHFNPKTDLSYDSQGVLQLCGANRYSLEQDISLYNKQRLEDSI